MTKFCATLLMRLQLVAVIFFLTSFTQQELSWVAIGDSITYLNDHPNETGNRVTAGYMTRVTEKLPNMKYINQGHNGWKAVTIADKMDGLGLVKADIYSVFLGTNDWWHGQPLGTFDDYQNKTGNGTVYGAFRTIIDKIRILNSAAKIILITPMQRGDFVYIANAKNNAWGSYKEKEGQSLEQFANAVNTIGKHEGIAVIDLFHTKELAVENLVQYKWLKDPQTGAYKKYNYPAYTSIPFDPEKDDYPYPVDAIGLTYDGLHPSDKGNQVIADKLLEVLKK